jgi:hypothetical protein
MKTGSLVEITVCLKRLYSRLLSDPVRRRIAALPIFQTDTILKKKRPLPAEDGYVVCQRVNL